MNPVDYDELLREEELDPPAPPERPASPEDVSRDGSDYERATRYVAKVPGVPKEQRNTTLNGLAYGLCERFPDLTEDEHRKLCLEFNARCTPPLSEREAVKTIESAWKACHRKGQVGSKQTPPRSKREGKKSNAAGTPAESFTPPEERWPAPLGEDAHCGPAGKDQAATPNPSIPGDKTCESTGKNGVLSPSPPMETFNPFPLQALPKPVSDFVSAGARAMCCDPSLIALPLLAGLASAIGNTRRIALKEDWKEPCILWVAVVADSGSMKSPAQTLALRVLRQEEMQRNHESTMTLSETESGQPVKYICSDVTVEALAVLLRDNPRGLLLARDELSGWYESFDAYKKGRGGDVSHWLSMHRAEPFSMDRKSGDNRSIYVPRASVSITGSIQPGILKRTLTKERIENGLAARFLFAMPPDIEKKWTKESVSQGIKQQLEEVFDALLALEFEKSDTGLLVPIDLDLTQNGETVWVRFFEEHNKERQKLADEHLRAVWAKLEGYAARFALLHHIIRSVAAVDPPTDPFRVDTKSMLAGITLAQWFGNEARRIYRMLRETNQQRETRKLIEYLRKKNGHITVRELTRGPQQYRESAEKAEAALNELVRQGYGHWVDRPPTENGGRPTREFHLLESGDGDRT